MPVGQDLEYNYMYDMGNQFVQIMLPTTTLLTDDLLESDDEYSQSDDQDTSIKDESDLSAVTGISEIEMAENEYDWRALRDLHRLEGCDSSCDTNYFFERNEDVVAPVFINQYMDALEDEYLFYRVVVEMIADLRKERRMANRTRLMMILTLLITGAPTWFLGTLDLELVVEVVIQALKEHNDITMMRNGVIFLKHLLQNSTVKINAKHYMEVAVMNCRRHSSPSLIEVCFDLLMLGAPDYGFSHCRSLKILEHGFRIHGLLSKNTQRNVLFLFSKNKGIINVKHPEMVRKFLTRFFRDLPRTDQKEDVAFRDGIISYVRNIYGAVMNNPDLVNGFTSRDFVEEIYHMLHDDVFGLPDTHKIIEILSIIAVHSEIYSRDLIDMGIANTLLDIYEKWFTGVETHKMDMVTLVWSLLPNLPEEFDSNKLLRRNVIRNLETLQWQREEEKDVWIPFTPSVSQDIEKSRAWNKRKQNLFIESDSIGEVDIKLMEYFNHSTDELKKVRTVEHQVYEVLKLEKTKKSTGFPVRTNFVHFAYLFVYERIYDCYYDIERYQCMEVLLSLVINMTRTQHDQIIPITANYTPLGTVQHLTEMIQTWKEDEKGILSMQILSELLRKFPDLYEEPCRREGVVPTVEYAFQAILNGDYLAFHSAQGTTTQTNPMQQTSTQETPREKSLRENSGKIYYSQGIFRNFSHVEVCLPSLNPTQVDKPQVSPPEIKPAPERLPQPKPPQVNPAQVNTRLEKPSQRPNTKTTPEDNSKISFRNQAKNLVRYIKKRETATVTATLPTKPKNPKRFCDELNIIKRIFEDTRLSLFEIRALGAVPKLLKILTEAKQNGDLYNELRTFLNVFANLPKEENAKIVEIESALFHRTVCILNDIVKSCFRVDSNWSKIHSIESIYIAGVQTLKNLSEKRIRISVLTSKHDKVLFSDTVYPFTTIEYLESYLMHVLNGKSPYKQWNESSEKKIELYLHGSHLPSYYTVLEAVRHHRKYPFTNVFDFHHMFTYEVKSIVITNLKKHPGPKECIFDEYLEKKVSISENEYVEQVMHLLQILYGLNRYWASLYTSLDHKFIIDTKEFLNPHVDRLVYNTLTDPLNVFLEKRPDWMCLIESCPFLLSFKTRKLAFSVLFLDKHRALKAVMEHYEAYSDALSFDDRYPLIEMDRPFVLDEFREALLHTDPSSSWNVLFFGENGTGIGVRKELYSEVGKELQKEKYKLWMKSSVTKTGYIHSRELYPDFHIRKNKKKGVGFENASVEEKFHIIGQIMAKALMEGHLLDLPLSLPVFKWLLMEESQLTLYDLKHASEELFNTFSIIKELVEEERRILNNHTLPPKTRNNLLKKLNADWKTVESYYLVFVLPNHEVELIRGGKNILVNRRNAALYIEKIEEFFLHLGVQKAMVALRTGFHRMINLDYLQLFEPLELQSLICGEENDKYWTLSHLEEYVELEDFEIDSPEVQYLFDILSTLSKEKRRKFLQFTTACPRLPADGFAGLTPALTVKSTDVYPFAQTCFHTLHLTNGMSKEQLEAFIDVAITHGVGYFGIV